MEQESNTLSRPGRLGPGDVIGIAAPASPFEKKEMERGLDVIKSLGYQVLVTEALFERAGYLAGTDRHRAGHLNSLFRDNNIKGIVSARGGYGAMRILPFLDYEMIGRSIKPFVGFSDITALLSVIYNRCGFISFHGPTVCSLGEADDASVEAFNAALSSSGKIEQKAKHPAPVIYGAAQGRVTGGNLTTLCHLLGTPYEPEFDGCILFLEDHGEKAYRIDRMLTQMSLAGCFDSIAGVALGSFEKCGGEDYIHGLFFDLFQGRDLPILGGLDMGHGAVNLTIPLGLWATLDADKGTLTFHESPTVVEA